MIYPTTSNQSLLILGYRWTPDPDKEFIEIELNIGTDDTPNWARQDVGLLGEEYQTAPDVIWDPIGSTLLFNAPLTQLTAGVRVSGTQRFSAITRHDDIAAIEKYGVLEGVIKDRSLITRERVLYKAQAVLNERATASHTATGALNDYIPVGQLVRITSTKFNVDRDYVVTSIEIRPEGIRELYVYQFAGLAGNVIHG